MTDEITVTVRKHAELAAPKAYEVLQNVEVSHDGSLLAMWTASPDERLYESHTGNGGARFPSTRPTQPVHTVVTAHQATEPVVLAKVLTEVAFPIVQRLPDGLLITGTRCYYTSDGGEQNATVFDFDGNALRTGCLGDGITCVRSTLSGNLWVGYFDEGIYGNFGWGYTCDPLGSSGVVLWSSEIFEKLWEPEADIADVYAATLVGDDLWASTYTDFPIRHLSPGGVDIYPTTDSGPRALITDGTLVATFGQYQDPLTFRVWNLSDIPHRKPLVEGRIVVPGLPAGTWPVLMGYRDELNILANTEWYRIALSDLMLAG